MSFNVWAPQGALTGLTTQSNPNVIYEANAQVLSGTVFKMWCTKNNGFGDLNYYESLDGLTSWTAHPSNPIGSGTGFNFPTVFHIGSTYYCYSGPENDKIYVRTSSDGITWGSATAAISRGTAGAWDDTDVAQLQIVNPGGTVGGLYYGYYQGISAHSALGLVTSPDLITWTKDAGNPAFDQLSPGSFMLINGTYYFWPPVAGGSAGTRALGYSGLGRLSAPAPNGPWTYLNNPANTIHQGVNYPVLPIEVSKDGTHLCGMSDACIISALGNMYLYWTKSTLEVQNQYGIIGSIATGITPTKLVASYEGVIGFPLPGPDGFNLNTLASDAFQRANANPMGGNWTPIGTTGGFTANQIVSHFVESTSNGTNSESFYNAVVFPNDQWSTVTLQTVGGPSNSFAGPSVRMDASKNEYRVQWATASSGLGTSGGFTILPVVAGAGGTSASLTGITASQGDTVMLAMSGTTMLCYLNGFPCLALTNSSLTAGSAGLTTVVTSGNVATAQLSAWSGGGFQNLWFGISGALGAAGAGATVSWSGPTSGSVTADGSGNYDTLEVLLPLGTYVITPTKTGKFFTPSTKTQTMATADVTGINFTGTAVVGNAGSLSLRRRKRRDVIS